MKYTIKFISISLLLFLSSCNKDAPSKGETNAVNPEQENTKGTFSLKKDPCQFFEAQLADLFEIGEGDYLGDCEVLANQYGAKTNFSKRGVGTAIYISSIPSNLADQAAIDSYYSKYLSIPDVEVAIIEGVGQGAVWLEKQRMLSFTQGEHT
ncbi:MAG: hypothetical protein P8P48_06580, partial [Saprospiraceae bacterium]|nr:hypothetical protein [Saprospiraceae bacterium]